MFIQAVHKASLDFLKTYKVPFPIFAKIILRKRKEEVQRFLQRTNWDKLEVGEQLLYAKLYKWLGQPVHLRLERLMRVDGTTTVKKAKGGILKKDSSKENEKEDVEEVEEVSLKPETKVEAAAEVEKHPKQTRLRKRQQPGLSAKEGHTSAEQRKQIREWSQTTVGADKDGVHSKEQKEALAAQLHLPLAVINRVIRYDTKISREQGRQVSTRSLGARSASLNLETNQQQPSNLENNQQQPSNLENNHQPSSPGTSLENHHLPNPDRSLEDNKLENPPDSSLTNLENKHIDKESHGKSQRLHQKIDKLKLKHENETNNLEAENIMSLLENSDKYENRETNNCSKSGNEEPLLKRESDVLGGWSYPVGEDLGPSGSLDGILHDELELLKSLEEEKLATEARSDVKEEEMPWEERAFKAELPPPPVPLPYQSPLLAPPLAFPLAPPLSQPSPLLDDDVNRFSASSEQVGNKEKEPACDENTSSSLSSSPSSPPPPPPPNGSSPPWSLSPPRQRTNSPSFTTLSLQGKPNASINNNNNDNDNSYNIIACESYFKTKPSPTEEEISVFIECMKVPIEVVKKYLSARKVRGKEATAEEGVKGHKVVLRPYRVVSRPLNLNQMGQVEPSQAQPSSPAAAPPPEQTVQVDQQPQTPDYETVGASLQAVQQPMDVQPPVKPTQPPPLAMMSQPAMSNPTKPVEEQKSNQTKPNPAGIAKPPAVINQVLRLQRRPAIEAVRRELTMIFGDKMFCTLDDLKPLAPGDAGALKKIYEDMSRQGKVQVVSEEFCRGLANGTTAAAQPLGSSRAPSRQRPPQPPRQQLPHPTYPASLLPPQTSCPPPNASPLSHFSHPANELVPTRGEENEHSRKRSPSDLETDRLVTKKIKVEEEVEDDKDDSGYLTNLDASSLNLGEASFNNMIKENVGEVNMLDDTLGLLDLTNLDMVDNMFDQLPEERTHDDMDTDGDDEARVKTEVKEEEELSDLRKLFYEREVSQDFSVSVVDVKPGFKKNILEVELSDGVETSTNFFFKIVPDSEELRSGQRVRLTSMGCIGARICVNGFEILGPSSDQGDLGTLPSIEEEFYLKLRRRRLEERNLFAIPAPKSLNDYIELEESVLHFIAGHGGKSSPLKTLFALSSSSAPLSPRLAKLLATHLGMARVEVESYLEKRQPKPIVALLHDHDYCDLPSVLA